MKDKIQTKNAKARLGALVALALSAMMLLALAAACGTKEAEATKVDNKGKLEGLVQTVDGKPIAEAVLTISKKSTDEPVPDIAPVSDADGKLQWANLPAGTYTFKLSAPGYEELEVELSIESNKTTSHTFVLKAKPAS